MTPLFSVLIASYDRPGYLQDALESVLASEERNFEVIVSDDCSPRVAEVRQVVAAFAGRMDVRLVEHSRNIGMAENWNALVAAARGDWVLLLGDDDELYSRTLRRLREHIATGPGADLLAFGYVVIDEEDRIVYERCAPRAFEIQIADRRLVRALLLSEVVPFWTCHPFTVCYRRSLGGHIHYDREALIGADLLFLYDCIGAGHTMRVLPEVLFRWRKTRRSSAKGATNLSRGVLGNVHARARIVGILRSRSAIHPSIRALVSRPTFERDYLHDAIDIDPGLTPAMVADLVASDPMLAPALVGYRLRGGLLARARIRARQVATYLGLFGISGMRPLVSYWRQRGL